MAALAEQGALMVFLFISKPPRIKSPLPLLPSMQLTRVVAPLRDGMCLVIHHHKYSRVHVDPTHSLYMPPPGAPTGPSKASPCHVISTIVTSHASGMQHGDTRIKASRGEQHIGSSMLSLDTRPSSLLTNSTRLTSATSSRKRDMLKALGAY